MLDAILEPIAKRRVDTNDPDWRERLASADPLAEAGIKPEVHSTLRALITHYAEGDEPARQTVRAIFERYRAFRWAAHIPLDLTPAGFRFKLLHFSAIDQGSDPRDEMLALEGSRRPRQGRRRGHQADPDRGRRPVQRPRQVRHGLDAPVPAGAGELDHGAVNPDPAVVAWSAPPRRGNAGPA